MKYCSYLVRVQSLCQTTKSPDYCHWLAQQKRPREQTRLGREKLTSFVWQAMLRLRHCQLLPLSLYHGQGSWIPYFGKDSVQAVIFRYSFYIQYTLLYNVFLPFQSSGRSSNNQFTSRAMVFSFFFLGAILLTIKCKLYL